MKSPPPFQQAEDIDEFNPYQNIQGSGKFGYDMNDDEQLLGGWGAENEDGKTNQAYGSFIKGGSAKPQTLIKVQNRLNKNPNNVTNGDGS